MAINEKKFLECLKEIKENAEKNKTKISVSSISDINNVPSSPGLYWITTTMPIDKIKQAILTVTGRKKRTRKHLPKGTNLIIQQDNLPYVIYSGTDHNIQKRLRQHLFNQGNEQTSKLGCIINEEPFSNYNWEIEYQQIKNYTLRYALESYWRLDVGWPQFCIR